MLRYLYFTFPLLQFSVVCLNAAVIWFMYVVISRSSVHKNKNHFSVKFENMQRSQLETLLIKEPVQYIIYVICSFRPYGSVAAVIRGWHCTVLFGPLHPVIFPSSSCVSMGRVGPWPPSHAQPRLEGGTRFTQPLLSVCRVHRPPQASPAPSRRATVHMKGSLSKPWVLHSLLLAVTETVSMLRAPTHGSRQNQMNRWHWRSECAFKELGSLPFKFSLTAVDKFKRGDTCNKSSEPSLECSFPPAPTVLQLFSLPLAFSPRCFPTTTFRNPEAKAPA